MFAALKGSHSIFIFSINGAYSFSFNLILCVSKFF